VRPEELGIEPYASDPSGDKPSELPCRYASIAAPTTKEEEIGGLFAHRVDVTIERLTGLLGHFEPDRPSGLLLADRSALHGMSVWRNVFDPEANEVAAPELAIDGKIEHGEIARPPLDLELGADRPNVLGSERGFRTNQFALVPGFAAGSLSGKFQSILHGDVLRC